MSHPLIDVKDRLDPVKDKSFIDRIAHAKVCPSWSSIEATCYCSKTELAHANGAHDEFMNDGDENDCRHEDCLSEKIDRAQDMNDLRVKDL